MNNSLARIIDGMIATIKSEVIPRLDDEFARGQAYGTLDLLNNLKPRIDWLVTPFYEEVQAQRLFLEQFAAIFAGTALQPPAPPVSAQLAPGTPAHEMESLRNRLDEHLCALIDWLAQHRGELPAAVATAAEAAFKEHMKQQLKREMGLTPMPLFAEIARS